MNVFEQVAAHFRTRQEKKASDFSELVKAVASGTAPSPAKIAELLELFGQTPEDLQSAVAYKQKRAELRRKLDAVPDLKAEQRKAASAYEKENERFAPLARSHEEKAGSLIAQVKSLTVQIASHEEAANQLLATADPSLAAELQVIVDQRDGLAREADSLVRRAAELKEGPLGSTPLEWSKNPLSLGRHNQEQAAEATAREKDDLTSRTNEAARLEKQASELATAIKPLDARAAAIIQAQLAP